ncbi:hypothetical protein [Roseateles sp. P5_E11]
MFSRQTLLVLLSAAAFTGIAHGAPCKTTVDIPQRLRDSSLLLLGELHGTRQIPDFVSAYVCNLAAQARSVALALEWPEENQAAIDAFLDSDGRGGARKALLGSRDWSKPAHEQDGRTSMAMLVLLDEVRQHNKATPTRKITVRAIDGDDLTMSRNVRALTATGLFSHVVVLTGDLHTSLVKGNMFDPAMEPMGFLLRDLHPISLVAEYDQGTAWNCAASQCEPHVVLSMPTQRGARYSISLRPPKDRLGYDGSFYVGRIDASPPAVLPTAAND